MTWIKKNKPLILKSTRVLMSYYINILVQWLSTKGLEPIRGPQRASKGAT